MLSIKIINSKNTEFIERCTRIVMTIAKHLHKNLPLLELPFFTDRDK